MSGIFISHTHSDKPVADAIAALVRELFGDRVQVHYSSDKEVGGGIAPGANWFRWIVEKVREADVALILLTPASTQKPWVIWEAGAVGGAAFATGDGKTERVVPIVFGLRSAEVPSPFATSQILSGVIEADIHRLVGDLVERFKDQYSSIEVLKIGTRQNAAIAGYLKTIEPALLKLPLVITEGAIQEWLIRLDVLERERRYSEVGVIESWMDVAFGREGDEQRPLDIRIHRRLGELYAAAKKPLDAARQFRLARQLVPRDIYILRRLGKAYLDAEDRDTARAVLDSIAEFDAHAFERNPENAALKARLYRENNNLAGARNVLRAALDYTPDSYYLGDLLGQVHLDLGELDDAKHVYRGVREIVLRLREPNVWTHAAALTAAIVCGDDDAIHQAIEALNALRPNSEQLASIERGARGVVEKLNRDPAILAQLHNVETKT